MNEMYWLTRLTSIVDLGSVIACLGWTVAIVLSLFYVVMNCSDDIDETWADFWKKCIKSSFIFAIIGTIITIFVPTTKEAFMIWGVGSTIDYIKSNEEAQQLPDKCIDYLDAWVEQITKENE